jgi:DNA-binding transcriptional MocR family regulator
LSNFCPSNATQASLNTLKAEFEQLKSQGLALDLTRGKPGNEQLSLSESMDGILKGDYAINGTDTRNYGGLDGIQAVKDLFAPALGVSSDDIIIGGNASLTMMYQTILFAHLFGLDGEQSAWKNLSAPKFICPVPGYDRHFSICEELGIEMITVNTDQHGPDMDAVEALLKADQDIIGMWNVPRFSNPSGTVYSDEVVERIAKLGQIAAPTFRVFWDNAYAVHIIDKSAQPLCSISQLTALHGTEDSVIQFSSTSKITFAGAGIAFMAASKKNRDAYIKHLGISSIGPDKINQLRHLKFFVDSEGLSTHMDEHAAILKPRFDAVLNHLNEHFSSTDALSWTVPAGGYFVSVDTEAGLAQRVVDLAGECGVKLTPAGATFPYGKDPLNRNIRLAPSFPSVEDINTAMQIFCVCVKLASSENALS